jgi:hypothetical protein
MIYLEQGNQEVIFALDQEHVYKIDPKTLEVINVFEQHYRHPALTCVAGRFSRTKNMFKVYIGNIEGIVKNFDFDEILLLQAEVCVFSQEKKTRITRSLDQLCILHDK